ncbi:MAG: hypothetical protein WCV90_01205 [Candidatus Woesearchaeota archaeon]
MVTDPITETQVEPLTTEIVESPEEMDFLSSLFEGADQQRAAEAVEPIELPPAIPEPSPLYPLARLLDAREKPVRMDHISGVSPQQSILLTYLGNSYLGEGREAMRLLEGINERMDRTGRTETKKAAFLLDLILAPRVGPMIGETLSLNVPETAPEYLNRLAGQFADRIGQLREITLTPEDLATLVPVDTEGTRKAVKVRRKGRREEREDGEYKEPSLSGLIAAQSLLPVLETYPAYAERIPTITDPEAILDFASLTLLTSGLAQQEPLMSQALSGELSNDRLVRLALFQRAQLQGKLVGLDPITELARQEQVLRSVSGYARYLSQSLTALPPIVEEKKYALQGEAIVKALEQRFNVVVRSPEIGGDYDLRQFERDLREGNRIYELVVGEEEQYAMRIAEFPQQLKELEDQWPVLWEKYKERIQVPIYLGSVLGWIREKTGIEVTLDRDKMKMGPEASRSLMEEILAREIEADMAKDGEEGKKTNKKQLRVGDKIVIVKAGGRGGYAHGGTTNTVPIGTRGKVTEIRDWDNSCVCALENRERWQVDREEIALIGSRWKEELAEKGQDVKTYVTLTLEESLAEARKACLVGYTSEGDRHAHKITHLKNQAEQAERERYGYDDLVQIVKTDKSKPGEYLTGEKTETFPPGCLAAMREYGGENVWGVRKLHGDYGKFHASEMIKLKEIERGRRREIAPQIAEIIEGVKTQYELDQQRKTDLVTQGVDRLRKMGVEDVVIRLFMEHHLTEEEFDHYAINEDIIPNEKGLYDDLEPLLPNDKSLGLFEPFRKLLAEREGIYLYVHDPRDQDELHWARFKDQAVEEVLFYGMVKKGTKGLFTRKKVSKGDKAVLTAEQGRYPIGTLGECLGEDDTNRYFFPTTEREYILIQRDAAAILVQFVEATEQYAQYVPGVKVRIRADSNYVDQGRRHGIGTLQERLGNGGWGNSALVTYEDGSRYNYRKRDLELVLPLEYLAGDEREKYLAKTAEQRARIQPVVAEILATVETGKVDARSQYHARVSSIISSLTKLGVDERGVAKVFARELDDYNHILADLQRDGMIKRIEEEIEE